MIPTGPYSPDTAQAVATGSTAAGWIEQAGNGSTTDVWATRYNFEVMQGQLGLLACGQRDSMMRLRKALLPTPATQVKILCAGDSITWGYGSADRQGYRAWLADLIDQQRVHPVMSNVSYPGWKLSDLQPQMASALSTSQPDIVLLNIGTNDHDTTVFTSAAYGALVDQILAFSPTVKVAVALVPISQADSNLISYEQAANNVIQATYNARSTNPRVTLVDLTQVNTAQWCRDNLNNGITPPPGRWTFDGVHPSDAGYLTMARMWANAVQPWVPGLTQI
ncbi:SGNH/GDSL hydrolase family protein [Kitasatospora sp. NPDC059408]|uniref:SGNH/GDSL hydrolase family protein n=1 Tax=Kitasatospora sp. NPDC059408 TaxID=3346823 RepID=UPI0036BB433F